MKTIDNTTELVGMIKLLICQYSEYQNRIDEDVKLTFLTDYNELTKDYKVSFSWIAEMVLIHTDPETSDKEYDEVPGVETFIFHETDSLIKLEQYVSDCLKPVSQTKLYSDII